MAKPTNGTAIGTALASLVGRETWFKCQPHLDAFVEDFAIALQRQNLTFAKADLYAAAGVTQRKAIR